MGRSADVPRVPGRTAGDDSGCPVLHVDMDAFFASVEVRRRPELRGRPVLVGGSTRGVVAAASYEARRYGVRSAMPMSQALRLCPNAIVLPPDRAAYSAASAQVMAILRSITPLVEPLSLDEAFLDVSGAETLLGRPVELATRIRARIAAELGLTCSVGIAPTKFVAKVASARCKPDGMLVVARSQVLTFLHPLPVTVLWGVGARTAEPLHRLGIRTIGDLAATPVEALRRVVGVAAAEHLSELANGRDPRRVSVDEVERSISADRTYDTDLTEFDQISRELLRLSDEVASRLRGRSMVARTIGVKIRFADFRTVTRVRTMPAWVDSPGVFHQVAADLYQGLGLDRPRVRLLGVKAEGLRESDAAAQQLSFDDEFSDRLLESRRVPDARDGVPAAPRPAGATRSPAATRAATRARRPLPPALDRAADDVKERFGAHAVRRATFLPPTTAQITEKAANRDPAGPPSTRSARSNFPDMNSTRILEGARPQHLDQPTLD